MSYYLISYSVLVHGSRIATTEAHVEYTIATFSHVTLNEQPISNRDSKVVQNVAKTISSNLDEDDQSSFSSFRHLLKI